LEGADGCDAAAGSLSDVVYEVKVLNDAGDPIDSRFSLLVH